MNEPEPHYLPALRFHWLTGWYDPVVRWTTREAAFKMELVRQTRLQPGQRVLDLGCGTGTLVIALKQAEPAAEVIGLDGDPAMLNRARTKANRAGVQINFDEGWSDALPYPAESFDCVVSSLFFHHLTRAAKQRTLAEVQRVLKPGGALYVADWGAPYNALMRLASYGITFLDGALTTADNINGLLPSLLASAGLLEVQEGQHFNTCFGTLRLHWGYKRMLA